MGFIPARAEPSRHPDASAIRAIGIGGNAAIALAVMTGGAPFP